MKIYIQYFSTIILFSLILVSCKKTVNNTNEDRSHIKEKKSFHLEGFYYSENEKSAIQIEKNEDQYDLIKFDFGSPSKLGNIKFVNDSQNKFRSTREQSEAAPLYTIDQENKVIKVSSYNAANDRYEISEYTQKNKSIDYQEYEKNIEAFIASLYSKKFDELDSEERRYQYAMYDLNGDGKTEYILTLLNRDFCGSGGCTFWVLDNKFKIISKTTVSDFPYYILREKTYGWNDLAVYSGKQLKQLKYDNKYPANASIEPEFIGDLNKDIVAKLKIGI